MKALSLLLLLSVAILGLVGSCSTKSQRPSEKKAEAPAVAHVQDSTPTKPQVLVDSDVRTITLVDTLLKGKRYHLTYSSDSRFLGWLELEVAGDGKRYFIDSIRAMHGVSIGAYFEAVAGYGLCLVISTPYDYFDYYNNLTFYKADLNTLKFSILGTIVDILDLPASWRDCENAPPPMFYRILYDQRKQNIVAVPHTYKSPPCDSTGAKIYGDTLAMEPIE